MNKIKQIRKLISQNKMMVLIKNNLNRRILINRMKINKNKKNNKKRTKQQKNHNKKLNQRPN